MRCVYEVAVSACEFAAYLRGFETSQAFVFNFVSPDIAGAYGLSATEIHEYGHHLYLSHPFDGFDYENRTDFGWDGRMADSNPRASGQIPGRT